MKNLRPAIKKGSDIHVGKEGSHHDDLKVTGQRGFVTPDGKFIPRSAANAWVKVNQPEVYVALKDKGALHTTEYNEAIKEPKKDDSEPGEAEKETQVTVDLSKKCVCIVDTGLALHLAPLLAKTFGRVLYHLPDSDAYKLTNRARIGTGIPKVERLHRLFDEVHVKREDRTVDLFIFPDACMVDKQKHLRDLGYPVVGCFDGDKMELNKEFFYGKLKEVGLPVAPYEVVDGLDELRKCLAKKKGPVHIKLVDQEYRGVCETFRCEDADAIEPVLDDIACTVGEFKDEIQFLVQDQIKSKCEIGFDALQLGRRHTAHPIIGIERKDEIYIAMTVDTLPEALQEYADKTAPILEELGVCGHRSTENRITDEGVSFGIDETIRVPSPPGELFPEMYQDGDYARAMWELGNGRLPVLTPKEKYGVQINIVSASLEKGRPVKVSFPAKVARYLKLKNFMVKKDGSTWVIPNGNDNFLGAVVATGKTLAEAVKRCQEYAGMVSAHKMSYEDDPMSSSEEARGAAAKLGINF